MFQNMKVVVLPFGVSKKSLDFFQYWSISSSGSPTYLKHVSQKHNLKTYIFFLPCFFSVQLSHPYDGIENSGSGSLIAVFQKDDSSFDFLAACSFIFDYWSKQAEVVYYFYFFFSQGGNYWCYQLLRIFFNFTTLMYRPMLRLSSLILIIGCFRSSTLWASNVVSLVIKLLMRLLPIFILMLASCYEASWVAFFKIQMEKA